MNIRDEQIRQRAYELWEKSGRTEGSEMDFWLQAERELAKEAGEAVPTTPPDLPEGKLE
ncbi:DUF2934 domain-containing protein [Bradyrhizobium prioriisuperbiae]|uniref:DUF2934 domain-containing protein n=1 Tax=Bradyrhizobium prioriisuperbiae TaxID=2854389 RepID=UPI0028EA04E0|nr:DUF2934 domain-containing protein [Bradyrhizobium prioritasuperba]